MSLISCYAKKEPIIQENEIDDSEIHSLANEFELLQSRNQINNKKESRFFPFSWPVIEKNILSITVFKNNEVEIKSIKKVPILNIYKGEIIEIDYKNNIIHLKHIVEGSVYIVSIIQNIELIPNLTKRKVIDSGAILGFSDQVTLTIKDNSKIQPDIDSFFPPITNKNIKILRKISLKN